ncbi:uncharacterized protein LOC109607180 isoform X1 [Aethina tumida]|uniref:uncharacterized protein LOC109607180 isoform X1 n=1 Tax=Aethina tumida TaxID=116153 RepID=UPI00214828A9|nr:uncharacterized protein LOC109607180 isoform X1 [Aethina tumida]
MCSTAECVIDQIADCISELNPSCPTPCVVEPQFPFAACCHVSPPPILLPTSPRPVKPLQLPCPMSCPPEMDPEEMFQKRYSNYYNYYNVDYKQKEKSCKVNPVRVIRTSHCEDYSLKRSEPQEDPGCPTGFKPCSMKMTPPASRHPCDAWCAKIEPCPPKRKKKAEKYNGDPACCTRPCCKHWQPKEGPCMYDCPCKAHCYNHPVGIKPGRAAAGQCPPYCCP